jgi:hypothetical protein
MQHEFEIKPHQVRQLIRIVVSNYIIPWWLNDIEKDWLVYENIYITSKNMIF